MSYEKGTITTGFVIEKDRFFIKSQRDLMKTDTHIHQFYAGESNTEPEKEAAEIVVDELYGFSKESNSFYLISDSIQFAKDFAKLVDKGTIDENSSLEDVTAHLNLDEQWLPVERY